MRRILAARFAEGWVRELSSFPPVILLRGATEVGAEGPEIEAEASWCGFLFGFAAVARFGNRAVCKRHIDPTISGADAAMHAIFRHIGARQRKFKYIAGAVGAVGAGAHIAIGKNASISHNNGLRADGSHINAHRDEPGRVPLDIRVFPVGLGPVAVILFLRFYHPVVSDKQVMGYSLFII